MHANRNLWPHGIVLAFAIFIAGTTSLVVLACSHKTDLVSADYYEQELKYQGQIERMNRAKNLDHLASVTYDDTQNRITISIPINHTKRSVTGSIYLYRPSTAGLDQQMKLELNTNGLQTINAVGLRSGFWKVKVLWSVGDQEYCIDQNLNVKS